MAPTSKAKALFVLALTADVLGVRALWPFGQKRYTEEALIDAGPLGVEGVGRVVAVGDWNGDQQCVSLFGNIGVGLISQCGPILPFGG